MFFASDEFKLRMDAAKWWVARVIADHGIKPIPRHPLSWIDEVSGAAHYPPAVNWLMCALEEFTPGSNKWDHDWFIVQMNMYLRRGYGEKEVVWVERFSEAVVAAYNAHLLTETVPSHVVG